MKTNSNNPSEAIWLLPYQCNPIDYLCTHIIHHYAEQLPDLSGIQILLPGLHMASRCRQGLTEAARQAGFPALLGPTITTLNSFVEETPHDATATPITNTRRELMLVDALRRHPELYGNSSPWLLAEELLQLFDALALHQTVLPSNIETFTSTLGNAYAIPDNADKTVLQHLSQEAALVHTLWQAWQQQLNDENLIDQAQCHIEKLNHFHLAPDIEHVFLVGFTQFLPAEQDWFTRLADNGKITLLVQGNHLQDEAHHPDQAIKPLLDANKHLIKPVEQVNTAYGAVINDIYPHNEQHIVARAQNIASQYQQSPIADQLSVFEANDAEQEAVGLELQIRQWLHEGKKNIGVITQDRRLARRLRALLERSAISLRDYSGWALSTTRAAAALERWLECIEQDFNHLPLLELLKSSFILSSYDQEQLTYNIYRFEKDIVLHENIASDLFRYLHQIQRRARRIDEIWTQTVVDNLQSLLEHLDNAAKPLQHLQQGKHSAETFLDTLLASLDCLEMSTSLNSDAAGQRIMDEISTMRRSVDAQHFTLSWSEFRHWLGRTLERYNFIPDTDSPAVHLLDFNSSLLAKFDAVIIASADAEHLPGRPAVGAFFNDAVRHSLHIPTATQYANQMYYYYRCLLHSAPAVLLSYNTNVNGNSNLACPWVECLQHYHEIAWQSRPHAKKLKGWLETGYAGYCTEDVAIDITGTPQHPVVYCDNDLLPATLSASAYQQIVNCPYQFFAARCLELQATEEIRLVLEKSDYGSRVHQCLQAFHSDIQHLPGPFGSSITEQNRSNAIQLLTDISLAVFSHDLEDNFQHRGWLQKWRKIIPHYIDWQVTHQQEWQFSAAEKSADDIRIGFQLKGRLDRVDSNDTGLDIIDYKTGRLPAQNEINTGEAVQLPFYALLLNTEIHRVEYLELGDKVKTTGKLEDDALHTLMAAQSTRLQQLYDQLHKGEGMPAWGDANTCQYCDMDGLCRREAWLVQDKVEQ